jgi:serine/threonine protein phosphatase PrpC
LHIEYGTCSDRGKVRSSNEDSYAANAQDKLFLVADGMGGHAAGEIASRIAAETVNEWVKARRSEGLAPAQILQEALREANARVYEAQHNNPAYGGMGSTLTALWFHDRRYHIAHVGDSRAYLLRNATLDQLTRDHSLVWHLYEIGKLKKANLSTHPQKSLITRSIGTHAEVEIDMEQGDIHYGDVFLLCSDGLTDALSDDDIGRILSDCRRSPSELGDALVNAANAAGGPDNITVIVIRVNQDAAENGEKADIDP